MKRAALLRAIVATAAGAVVWYVLGRQLDMVVNVAWGVILYYMYALWVVAAASGAVACVAARGRWMGLLCAALAPTVGVVVVTTFGHGGWSDWDSYLLVVGLGWVAAMGLAGGLIAAGVMWIATRRGRRREPSQHRRWWIGWAGLAGALGLLTVGLLLADQWEARQWEPVVASVKLPVYPGASKVSKVGGRDWRSIAYIAPVKYPSLAVAEYIAKTMQAQRGWSVVDYEVHWSHLHTVSRTLPPAWIPNRVMNHDWATDGIFGPRMNVSARGPGERCEMNLANPSLKLELIVTIWDFSMDPESERPAWAKGAAPIEYVAMWLNLDPATWVANEETGHGGPP